MFESVVILLLLFTGGFLTLRTRFFSIRHPVKVARALVGNLLRPPQQDCTGRTITPFQAMSTTLAGTLGVGSISGIATAITLGGPGSIFWMWVSAFFGMTTKYAEIVLAVHFSSPSDRTGGPMIYLKKGLSSPFLACFFCVCCVAASFGIGGMVQSNAIAQALDFSFGVPGFVTGCVFTLLAAFVILGGIQRIARFSEKLVPTMSLCYFVLAIIAILRHSSQIPAVFTQIFSQAFSVRAAAGGVFGSAAFYALRYGVSRGIFSNEAGLGSSPIAHTCTAQKSPAREGVLGIFEVFIDTFVMCTLTALVILTSGIADCGLDASALVGAAFGVSFGSFGEMFVSISIVFFAFSSILGWCFYAEQCLRHLFQNAYYPILFYRMALLFSVMLGAVLKLQVVWGIADCFNMAMAIPNLIGLLGLSSLVVLETKRYFAPQSIRKISHSRRIRFPAKGCAPMKHGN